GRRCRHQSSGGLSRCNVQNLPDREPWRLFAVAGEPPGHLVHEREEDRLERKVVPTQIERGRKHDDSSTPLRTFDQRRLSRIEARQDRRVLRRRYAAIAVKAGAGEVSASRRPERFEDLMAEV